jgi:hypothetical protein
MHPTLTGFPSLARHGFRGIIPFFGTCRVCQLHNRPDFGFRPARLALRASVTGIDATPSLAHQT